MVSRRCKTNGTCDGVGVQLQQLPDGALRVVAPLDDSPAEKARQYDAWITVQRGHAVANGIPVIAVNRTGYEADWSGTTNGIEFWGQSFVAGPQGEILYKAPVDQEINHVINIDMDRSEEVRRIWPFLRDRRIDAYGDLVKRYRD